MMRERRPQVDSARAPRNVAWPDRLITRHEAIDKAADWPLAYSEPGAAPFDVSLYCQVDGQAMGQLRRGHVTYNGTLDELLSAVLRHMVMAHDVPLNTRANPTEPIVILEVAGRDLADRYIETIPACPPDITEWTEEDVRAAFAAGLEAGRHGS